MTVDFNIPADLPVDESLHQPDMQSMPWITWYGKASPDNADTGGFWGIKADSIEGQTPGPEGWWKLVDMRYGTNPNAEPEPTWTTSRLRCVPIGVRKRQVITVGKGHDKKEYYFPFYTKTENRKDSEGNPVDGRFQQHYQVMVMVDGLDDPVMLTLKGYTKTKCWDNMPDQKYGNKDFPKGVEPILTQMSADVSKQQKTRMPWLHFWYVDLCPAFEKGKPLWVEVGKEDTVYMNPYVADMRTSKETNDDRFPKNRFIGTEKFIAYQNLRRDVAMDWEAAWSDADALAASSTDGAYDYDEPAKAIEDNDIPF